MSFGAVVREVRRQAGVSLRTLAATIGVTPGFLSRVERGEYPAPSERRIRLIAAALAQDPDYLVALAGRLPDYLRRMSLEHPVTMARLFKLIHRSVEVDLQHWIHLMNSEIRDTSPFSIHQEGDPDVGIHEGATASSEPSPLARSTHHDAGSTNVLVPNE
jgi:HTH-type transcriptional regulator, competence development regulator